MMTVLLVEDEVLISMSIESALVDAGFQVRTESEGLRALAQLQGQPVQAAIVDLGLPDCSGADVVRELRRLYPEMFIVLCTGFTAQELEEFGRNLNVMVIEKPVAESRLVSLIEHHCARVRPSERRAAPDSTPPR